LLLCASTERATLAAPTHGVSPKKDAERRDKGSGRIGRTIGLGKPGEKPPKRRRCYKRHRWLVSKRQPER
jgi:hypothetical protein